ncbi:serpin 85F [Cochliomyia hominivorax]
MADNCQRCEGRFKIVTCVLKTLNFLIIFLFVSLISIPCNNAHLIHIDHNEYHANGFPRTHLPPPPIIHAHDELPPHFPVKELTPSEYMVDLTNDLAYRILHYHSILNRNNFAFSPTALMSVLVAIFEGSAGRSKTELKNVLQLPNNNDIIRVGYRDIHRRLRTYFFVTDNPLKGLSLNKENVTIARDFEAILMFYGYDLGIDMISSTAMPTITTTTMPTVNITDNTISIENTKISTTTTSTLNTETTTTETTTPKTTSTELTTEAQTSTTKEVITTTTTTEENLTTPKPEKTTEMMPESTSKKEETTTETATVSEMTEATKPESEINEAAELISSFVAEENSEPFLRIQKAKVTRLPSAKLQAPITPKTKPQINYLPAQRKAKRLTNRNKRHLLGFKDFESNLFVTLFNAESSQFNTPLTTGSALTGLPTYVQVAHDYEVDTDPNFIAASHQSSNLKHNYNTDVISHVFYLSNQHVIYTTFKVYNAVLYYKYFERLRLNVLELELDTPDYNLIILLPDYNTDLVSAAASLGSGPKLRLMRKQLKPKWVQAIIPDFKLHGTMFLTNDLQNLGICDIFEPNRADFRPMTEEKGTYVKHIEQTINVHIRTNPINQLRRNNGAQIQPIQISVNHPFMFFIIDRDLDVAVMAGRILNPLNVRVQ